MKFSARLPDNSDGAGWGFVSPEMLVKSEADAVVAYRAPKKPRTKDERRKKGF
jgi:hypothetical protein